MRRIRNASIAVAVFSCIIVCLFLSGQSATAFVGSSSWFAKRIVANRAPCEGQTVNVTMRVTVCDEGESSAWWGAEMIIEPETDVFEWVKKPEKCLFQPKEGESYRLDGTLLANGTGTVRLYAVVFCIQQEDYANYSFTVTKLYNFIVLHGNVTQDISNAFTEFRVGVTTGQITQDQASHCDDDSFGGDYLCTSLYVLTAISLVLNVIVGVVWVVRKFIRQRDSDEWEKAFFILLAVSCMFLMASALSLTMIV